MTDDPRPEDRQVIHVDPIGWTTINRPKLLRMFYTLLIYGCRNRPAGQVPRTRFDTWWTLVGWPIELAAHLYDPALHFDLTECFKATEALDTQKAGVVAALNLLRRQFGSVPRGVPVPQSVRFGSTQIRSILDGGEQARMDLKQPNAQALIDLAGEFLDLFEALYGKRLRSPSKSKLGEALKSIVDRPEDLDPATVGILRLSIIHGLWWFHVETHTPTGAAGNTVSSVVGSPKGAQPEPPTPDNGEATCPEDANNAGRGLTLSPLGGADQRKDYISGDPEVPEALAPAIASAPGLWLPEVAELSETAQQPRATKTISGGPDRTSGRPTPATGQRKNNRIEQVAMPEGAQAEPPPSHPAVDDARQEF
jgi:hypothetical protein